jgi:hypothetical protein
MSRLIDADALKSAIDEGWKPDMMVSEIWEIIDEMPTIAEERRPSLPCGTGRGKDRKENNK